MDVHVALVDVDAFRFQRFSLLSESLGAVTVICSGKIDAFRVFWAQRLLSGTFVDVGTMVSVSVEAGEAAAVVSSGCILAMCHQMAGRIQTLVLVDDFTHGTGESVVAVALRLLPVEKTCPAVIASGIALPLTIREALVVHRWVTVAVGRAIAEDAYLV